jgi:phosphatidylinositol alpha-1,6-mannosyltransferase
VVAEVPEATLWIVGDGDDRERLETFVSVLGIEESVRFKGHVSNDELVTSYEEANVFALPGRARLTPKPKGEGFGLVFVEAAAAGLPCIAGRAAGAAEAVKDGTTGVLVDPLSHVDVANAVVHLLQNPDQAQEMGEAGRKHVNARHTTAEFRSAIGSALSQLASS